MKRVLSLILAVILAFSTAVTAFAQSFTPTVDKTVVKAGEDVTVTLSFEEAVVDVTSFEARLYFNSELFNYKSNTLKNMNGYVTPEPITDSEGTYMEITHIEMAGKGTVEAGEYAKITFTAKENVSSEQVAEFVCRVEEGLMADQSGLTTENVKISVTVSPVICDHSETETAYTAKGDGNHTAIVTCKKCSAVINTFEEPCTEGEDGKCVHCGYVFPSSGDEYTVTVKVVPNTVDVTFYSGENAETELPKNKVEHVGIDGYNVYKLTVPKGTYSYRATDREDDVYLGGMSFAVPVSTEVDSEGNTMITDQSITLVRNNFYTINNKVSAIGDYSIDIYPAGRAAVVNGTQYINDNGYVVTPTMLQAHGNALTYNYRITLNGELGNNYGVPFVSNYTITSTVSETQNRTFFLNELTAYSITAPAGATVKYFRQINNFNVEEIPVSETVTNSDGTVTYKVKVTGPNYTYRVSMEGKLTKAGYLNAKQKEFVITFGENENPKSTVNAMENTEMAKRIESSTLVNVNAKNELSLGVGETFRLRSYRAAWQIINSDTDNIMIEPDFNYKVISGGEHIRMTPVSDRCTGNAGTGKHSNWMDIKGVSAGVAILEVSYDAIEIGASARGQGAYAASRYTGTYGATDPKRTALVVINVGGAESELSMTAKDADHEWDAEFDTVYTFENTATLNFTATLGGDAPAVQLSTDKGESWKSVSVNGDGSFTATGLSEGNNILKFTANGKTAYQVVRAAKLTYTVTNLTTKDASEIYVGDTARIVFRGLYQPMPKISGIYNPGYGNSTPAGNQIIYNIPEGAKQGGRSGQYSFVGTNKYDITINEEGKFVLTGGYIDFSVMAHENPAGEHRTIPDNGVGTNFNATETMFKYCVMPDLTIEVKAKQEHSWGEPTYVWSSDNGTCTATRSCALHDNETETETANCSYKELRAATCEEKGEGKYTAEFKNSAFTKQEKTVDIPALGHKLVRHDAKEATCAAEGNIEYWECSVCKKQFADSKGEVLVNTVVTEKNPNKHTGGTELKNDKAATCGEEGYTGDICCKGCEAVLEKGKTIPKTPHSWKTPAYTWNEDNKTVTAKVVCNNDSTHEHSETVNTTAESEGATCTEKGKVTYTAEFGGNEYGFTTQTKVVENAALGHDWGETVYTWSSDNKTVTAKHTCGRDSNHTEEETANSKYSVVKAATCEEKGEDKYTAEFKKFAATEKTVEIPALGHKLVHHDAKEATCAAEGNIEYWECSVCKKQFADSKGEVLVNTVVIKKNPDNHTGGTELKNDRAATCGEEGYTGDICCKGCGAVLEKGKTIPKTPHSWKTPAYTWSEDNKTVTAKVVCNNDSTHEHSETVNTTAESEGATCTEKGKVTYTAEFGENEYEFTTQTKVVENAALGHDWGETVYTWSNDNKTVTAKHTCGRDSNHTEEETANSKYSVVKAATCEEKGEGKYTAEFKKFAATEKTVKIPALGHKLVHHDAKEATCAAEGNIEYWECSVCKKLFSDKDGKTEVKTVVTEKNPNKHTGGTELKNDKAATCGEEGYTGDICCKGCGAVLEKGKTIPKTPHNWKEPAYTWSEDNKTVTAKRVCANDSNHTETETANCSYKELRAATCEEKGEGKYTAEFKNSAFTKQEKTVDIPALGHKLVRHDAKAATCIAEGNIEYWECSVCKKLFSDKDGKTEVKTVATEKNPNNHTGETEVKNYVEATCTKSGYTGDTYCKSCEKLISAGKASPVVPHKFGAWVIIKAPTTLSNGTKVRSCTACGYEESAIIPRLTDNDDVIHIGIGEKNEEKNPETGAQAPSGLAAAVLIAAAVLMSTKKRK